MMMPTRFGKRPHQPCGTRPQECRHHEREGEDVIGWGDRDENDDDHQEWQHHEEVDDAHHDVVYLATEVAGNDPVYDTKTDTHECHEYTDFSG